MGKKAELHITYVFQTNSGKHIAHNHGVKSCKTDLFLCVDSDDTLNPHAVETIWNYWQDTRFPHASISGFCARRWNTEGENDKTNWPSENKLLTMVDLQYIYHFKGETALVWITNEIKKYFIPVVIGEKFVPETVLYFQVKKPLVSKSDYFYEFAYHPDG